RSSGAHGWRVSAVPQAGELRRVRRRPAVATRGILVSDAPTPEESVQVRRAQGEPRGNVLACPSCACPLPGYTHHLGRDVIREPWTVSAQAICLGPAERECCGSTAAPLFAAGRAQPLPGETFTATKPRRSGHREGMAVKEVQVPAWAVYRLCAFRCPDCGCVDILDIEQGYEPVDTEQPTLF